MAATELETTTTERRIVTHVDTAEVPSAAWGWSGESPRTFRIAGLVVALILLGMLFEGPQGSSSGSGNIGYMFLVGFAALLGVILLRDAFTRNKPR
ncbi:DUF2631 domain-containing protein [Nocardia goodfellowii]|uniref:DUF2631 domain-containing protein n=1 Tax=Nocardia goodfellowii TaxID=882446 RepID=A0ABS4QEK4_9NOCA|nr:DUF2631 domain-containing protein [Nocardia goodfellowii]MBP2190128.1 hypothetical protein [Nocardia goodfellowii]